MASLPPTGTTRSRWGALRHRDFSFLWVGLLLSNSGTWMQTTAQSYLVYELTRSPLALGLLGLSSAVPMLLLPPLGGVTADRANRLTLLRINNLAWIAMTCVLAALTWTGRVAIWHILLLSFLSSLTLAFDNPTRQALVPDLVPRADLLSAISLNSITYSGASLVGPAVAGLIMRGFGADIYRGAAMVFYINAVSYLAVLIPVLFWIRAPAHQREGPRASMGADLLEGLRYVKQQPPLLLLLSLTAVTSVFGRSYSQLMPVFARDVLHAGSAGLGLMYSAPGAGTIVGGALLAALAHAVSRRRLVTIMLPAFTVLIFGFTFSRSYPLSLLLLFLIGASSTIAAAAISTMLQARAPGQMRGRVMSLWSLAAIGMNPLGGLLSGALATVVPAPIAVSATAAIVLVFLGFVVLTQPAWKEIDSPPAG